jgi:hypothetical protein
MTADKKDEGPVLNTVYPDATAIFEFQPVSVKDVLSEGMIVLDTNTLLTPYGTGPTTLEQIKKTYKTLISEKRLVVPGQVAREFARHRPEQLKNLYKEIGQRRHIQPAVEYHLLAELPEYQDVRAADLEVDKAVDARSKATRALLLKVKSWLWDDPISSLYRDLFGPDVVIDPPIDSGFDEELQRRTLNKIPPGYKDAAKDDGGPGDLLIWQTILHIGKTKKSHVMFVTGEEKPDWWHRSSDGPLYPRYELLDEFRRASEGKTFHIMNFAELLKEFGAEKSVVEEVRREQVVIDIPTGHSTMSRRVKAQLAVRRWLANHGTVGKESGEFPDFWLETPETRTAVEIKLVGQQSLLQS